MQRETEIRLTVTLDDYEHFALKKIMEFHRLRSKAMAVRQAINSTYASLRIDGNAVKTPVADNRKKKIFKNDLQCFSQNLPAVFAGRRRGRRSSGPV